MVVTVPAGAGPASGFMAGKLAGCAGAARRVVGRSGSGGWCGCRSRPGADGWRRNGGWCEGRWVFGEAAGREKVLPDEFAGGVRVFAGEGFGVGEDGEKGFGFSARMMSVGNSISWWRTWR